MTSGIIARVYGIYDYGKSKRAGNKGEVLAFGVKVI